MSLAALHFEQIKAVVTLGSLGRHAAYVLGVHAGY
jgi:hypothetical protein